MSEKLTTGKSMPDINMEETTKRPFTKSRLFYAISFVVVVIVGIAIASRMNPQQEDQTAGGSKHKTEAVPVLTAVTTMRSLPLEIRNIGNVEAYSTVNVLAQVGGQLTHVYFKEGDGVKQGQLLFQIDPRPYQAQLDQAQANVVRDKSIINSADANLAKDMAMVQQAQANLTKDLAQERYAEVEVKRYQTLVQEGAVSHEQSDQIRTSFETAQATVSSDKAAIENAKAVANSDKAAIAQARASLVADQSAAENLQIQLGFTQIHSPVDGVTGALNFDEGNVVRPNDTTPLVVINQIAPIYITFSVPETSLDQIRKAQALGILQVKAFIDGNKKDPVMGQLSFIDNTVDKTTGAIKLKATFVNTDRRLWPGRFVDVAVDFPAPAPQIVIPSRAVQSDQQGQSVFVLKANNTVAFVPVEVERTYKDDSVITKGLKEGDIVITDGQLKLTPGATVRKMDSTKAATPTPNLQ